MTKNILDKNILDLIRIPEFFCFLALQFVLLILVVFNQLPHILLSYIFKFNIILFYFLSAYLSAKFVSNLRKTNGFAFIFMKPISKSIFSLLSILSILFAMLIPLVILFVSILTFNYHASIFSLRSDIVLDYDKGFIREHASLIHSRGETYSSEQIYKELLLQNSTILPGKVGIWNFVISKDLQGRSFIIEYNRFFNVINQFNTNSYWRVNVDENTVFTAQYKFDGLPTGILDPLLEHGLSKNVSVEFFNNSTDLPVMFVPNSPVKLIFRGGSVSINLLKSTIKTCLNLLFVIALSFVASIFMSPPGAFFTSYLSILSALLYKFFYLNNNSLKIFHIIFGSGFNEALNSKYIYLDQLVLFGGMVVIFLFFMIKVSEYLFKSNSFYIENRL